MVKGLNDLIPHFGFGEKPRKGDILVAWGPDSHRDNPKKSFWPIPSAYNHIGFRINFAEDGAVKIFNDQLPMLNYQIPTSNIPFRVTYW